MKRVVKRNPRFREYLEYIDSHRIGVVRSWVELLMPYLDKHYQDIDSEEKLDLQDIDKTIQAHDTSKYEDDEFIAYCNYFYPSEGFEKDEAAFDVAWLLHQHKNPHHPQYWVLLRDSGELVALDMEFKYICEMLCDWHSFSLRDEKSTAYSWWQDNKSKMVLSDNTSKIVEELIDVFKEPLTKND